MDEILAQRILIEFVRRHAPQTYAEETEQLRARYNRLLSAARQASERKSIAREYRQARIAMVSLLAREVSLLSD